MMMVTIVAMVSIASAALKLDMNSLIVGMWVHYQGASWLSRDFFRKILITV